MGAVLRAIRLSQTTLTLEQVAEQTQMSLSTLSRIENGRRHISREDMATLLTVYKVPLRQRRELYEDAHTDNRACWWQRTLPEVLPDSLLVAGYGTDARVVTDWSIAVVPELLLTYRYARGWWRASGATDDEIERRWNACQEKQRGLSQVEYTAYIHELALRTPFGGVAALRDQLAHLIAAPERGLGIRMVRAGVPVGALGSAWTLIQFRRDPPVVHSELLRSSIVLHHPETSSYRAMLKEVERAACSAAATRERLRQIAETLSERGQQRAGEFR
ncbi:helix-turn-helix domain-containing protein [Actinokineospora fastidiosa]|uniref:helix-turn-helix domain-containing protein n=1 Tax=Actinokineospora fastidiosa TaxID=1816 RepID=UPI001670016A|nr:helix-turn-helix transcriptional regulator [Actinokineospora fastidiosa]